MIELRDTVSIDAPPAEVWAWLETLPEHYLDWHPDHVDARWVRGRGLAPGSVMEATEVLHGKPHRLTVTSTGLDPGHWTRYRMFPGLGGELRVEPSDGGTEFTAVVRMGTRTPVVGPALDRLLRLALGRRIAAVEQHQKEEGVNLKALLEHR